MKADYIDTEFENGRKNFLTSLMIPVLIDAEEGSKEGRHSAVMSLQYSGSLMLP
jgi:hypothetical protein